MHGLFELGGLGGHVVEHWSETGLLPTPFKAHLSPEP